MGRDVDQKIIEVLDEGLEGEGSDSGFGFTVGGGEGYFAALREENGLGVAVTQRRE